MKTNQSILPAKQNAVSSSAVAHAKKERTKTLSTGNTIAAFNFASTPLFANGLPVQPKLTINQPNDRYEQEADAMVDKVMRMEATNDHSVLTGSTAVQRKCAHCEEEEEEKKSLQRKESGVNTPAVSQSFTNYVGGLDSGGMALSADTRNFFEPKLGYDFSKVRIHHDASAARSAKDISALAYTHGRHIVFDHGKFSPTTTAGKRLLGHELVHVMQQSGGSINRAIQRTPSEEELRLFDEQATTIRNHEALRRLPARARQQVREIITMARTRDNWQYYLTNLLALLNTPNAPETAADAAAAVDTSTGEAPELSTREMNEAEVSESLSAERSRLYYPAGRNAVNSEETQSTTPPRVWTMRRGEGGKRFRVDARDPGNIFVKIKVKLNGRNAQDIANVREMEDGIEKRVATFGYTVDLEFVNRSANDVFDVGVNLAEWTDSGNWSGGLNGLAHEMHHLMGLDDRYNYIDSHAENEDMDMDTRIHWFRVQMDKTPGANDEDSIMNSSSRGTMLTDDVAAVAGISEASVAAGQQARRDLINSLRRRAAHRVSVAYLRVNGTNPHFNRLEELETVRGLIAPDIVNLEQIAEILGRMHSILMGGQITVGPEIDACSQWVAYVMGNRVPIHLCNSFFAETEEQQIRTLIHEAAHAVGIGEPEHETYFPIYDCGVLTQDNWGSADAWSRYVHCISGQTPDEGEDGSARP